MMIMTAKVNFKKIMLILICIAAALTCLILLLGDKETSTAATSAMSANDNRVKFLEEFGWEVTPAPKESTQVKIPDEAEEMFRRYNTMQKGQGYDLSKFTGKRVMRYVYEIRNFPGATEPVYATVLVYKNKIIGGDITDTSAHGKVRPFQMPPMPEVTRPTQQGTENSEPQS